MSEYYIPHERRALLEKSVEAWFTSIPALAEIKVELTSSVGRRKSQTVGTYEADEVDELEPGQFIDLLIGEHGQRGGKLRIRAYFYIPTTDESATPAIDYEHPKSKTLTMVKDPTGSRGPGRSTGADAAVEGVVRSVTSNLDSFARRLEGSHDQTIEAVRELGTQTAAAQAEQTTFMLETMKQMGELGAKLAASEAAVGQAQAEHGLLMKIAELERPSFLEQMLPALPRLAELLQPLAAAGAAYVGAKARRLDAESEAMGLALPEAPPPVADVADAPPVEEGAAA